MTMINTETLDTLLSLHNENQQNAELILANIIKRKNIEESKLSQLIDSREQYIKNFQQRSQKGLNSFIYNQYTLYIFNMENLIAEQYKNIENIQKESEIAKLAWIETKKQVAIYSNIKEKQAIVATNAILKKEQKQQDEWALRQYYDKNKEK